MINVKTEIKDFDFQGFFSFVSGYLGMEGDVTLHIYHDDYVLDRFSPAGYELQALLYRTPLPGSYNLYLRTGTDELAVLSHEAIHLSQYERGDLMMNIYNGECTWKGEVYTSKCPYMLRPWEKEAFKRQRDLIKSYKKFIKSKRP